MKCQEKKKKQKKTEKIMKNKNSYNKTNEQLIDVPKAF